MASNIEGTEVTISWDAPEESDCVTGYILEYNDELHNVDVTVTSYTPEDLEYCINNEIKVAAVGSTEEKIGEYSSVYVEVGAQLGNNNK